jgi:hypothetical protein
MAKRKQDARQLLRRAIESLALSVELFNRPSEVARSHVVLITLHHAFEMLLKAAILRRTGTIHPRSGGYSYSFEHLMQSGGATVTASVPAGPMIRRPR